MKKTQTKTKVKQKKKQVHFAAGKEQHEEEREADEEEEEEKTRTNTTHPECEREGWAGEEEESDSDASREVMGRREPSIEHGGVSERDIKNVGPCAGNIHRCQRKWSKVCWNWGSHHGLDPWVAHYLSQVADDLAKLRH